MFIFYMGGLILRLNNIHLDDERQQNGGLAINFGFTPRRKDDVLDRYNLNLQVPDRGHFKISKVEHLSHTNTTSI